MPTANAINANSTGLVKYDGAGNFTATIVTNHSLLVGGTSNAITSLPLTNGQIPIGSTGADPVAATLTAGTGISITPAAGSISIASTVVAPTVTNHAVLVGGASNAITSIPLTNGQLAIGSTGADPVAATLTAGSGITITPAAGSITIAASGGSSGLTLISTQDAVNSATISFTGLTTYNCLKLIIRDLVPATSTAILGAIVSTDGVTYLTTGYSSGVNKHNTTTVTYVNNNSTAQLVLSPGLASTDTYCVDCTLWQMNSSSPVMISGFAQGRDSSANFMSAQIGGQGPVGAGSMIAIRFAMTSGNITSGHFALYGLASS